ncbi:MAG: NYN domain-containing protein [Roseiflexaceae bacterium]|jgi:uncharacterized protein (TIGR00288 family)
MSEQSRNDVAVFIDFENVYVGVRDKLDANPNFEIIMERCNELGRCILARAYADWYRYPRITSALYANNIEPMYVPTYYYDKDAGRTGRPIKNSADMNLCIDAMRTLFMMPGLKTFVLVTGDRDFIPLVHAIRQHGKDVVIIGVGGAASSHLAQSADEFIFYEHLIGKTVATPAPTPPSRRISDIDEYERPREQRAAAVAKPERKVTEPPTPPANDDAIYALLAAAILEARARNMAGIGSLQLLMKELSNGEFRVQSVRDAQGRPIDKFKDFIKEAARRGKVVISTDGAANEVFLPGEDPRQLSRLVVTSDKVPERKDAELTAPHVESSHSETVRGESSNKSRRRRRRGDSTERDATPASDAVVPVVTPPPAVVAAPVVPNTVSLADTDVVLDDDENTELAATMVPFSDEERTWVRAMVAASDRSLSFQQIHDQLREKRKREGGIQRTNEELRSLIKIAINTGELQRIGRGNRVSYRVASTGTQAVATQAVEQPTMVPTPEREHVPAVAAPIRDIPVDDGLDMIVTTTALPQPRRPKSKSTVAVAAPAQKATPPRTPAAETPSRSATRKSATKPAQTPSRSAVAPEVASPIPSPLEEPTPVKTVTKPKAASPAKAPAKAKLTAARRPKKPSES